MSADKCDCGKIEHGRHHMDCPALKPTGSADKCQVCGENLRFGNRLACSSSIYVDVCSKAERLAIERAKEIETLKAEIERLKKEMMK